MPNPLIPIPAGLDYRRPLVAWIALSFDSIHSAESHGRKAPDFHAERIDNACRELMPSGSGVDSGTNFQYDESRPERLVFTCSFHHMNSVGFYDGWTDHRIIVTPSLAFGFRVEVKGRNRNGIKEYLRELFSAALETEYPASAYHGGYTVEPADSSPPDLPPDLH